MHSWVVFFVPDLVTQLPRWPCYLLGRHLPAPSAPHAASLQASSLQLVAPRGSGLHVCAGTGAPAAHLLFCVVCACPAPLQSRKAAARPFTGAGKGHFPPEVHVQCPGAPGVRVDRQLCTSPQWTQGGGAWEQTLRSLLLRVEPGAPVPRHHLPLAKRPLWEARGEAGLCTLAAACHPRPRWGLCSLGGQLFWNCAARWSPTPRVPACRVPSLVSLEAAFVCLKALTTELHRDTRAAFPATPRRTPASRA